MGRHKCRDGFSACGLVHFALEGQVIATGVRDLHTGIVVLHIRTLAVPGGTDLGDAVQILQSARTGALVLELAGARAGLGRMGFPGLPWRRRDRTAERRLLVCWDGFSVLAGDLVQIAIEVQLRAGARDVDAGVVILHIRALALSGGASVRDAIHVR